MYLMQSFPVGAFYIDPATTSYIIQIAVGAVVAIGAVIGIFGNKIRRAFRKKNGAEDTPAAQRQAEGNRKKDISASDLMDDGDDGAKS